MSESETRRHKARRPHNKSRTGCVQCKQRKVKCDETKPVCKKCTGYGATCSFLQTHPQPGAVLLPGPQMQQPATSFQPTTRGLPTIQSMLSPESLPLTPPQPDPPSRPMYPVNFTMLDLELLHYFILEAAESYLEKSNIAEAFRTSVLQIAFEHPFLMHELLSLSALSLAHHRPEKRDVYLHASDTHAAAGLALFQPEVANLGPGNCHACFVFSTTFLTHAWVAQDLNKPSTLFFRSHIQDHESVTIQWVKLHRGTNAILDQFFPLFCEGPLKALLSPWKDLDPDRADPINEEEERHLHFLAKAWRDSLILSEDEKHILDKAALAVRRVYSMLVYYPEVGRLSVVMNWFSIIPDEFVKMLEEKRPEALLVAIYQCVALKQLDHVWWTQGKAENLFKTLYDVLPDQWEAWTLWPMEKVFGSKDALLRKQWKIPNET